VRVLIYKILLPSQWAEFEAAGSYAGSPFDHESGFIHCSSRAQLAETARKHFGGEPELVVLAIDEDRLRGTVRWEPAPHRGGEFPHIYGMLPMSAVTSVRHISGAEAVDGDM
jgi:uncharacterized protein (DUF952 family)